MFMEGQELLVISLFLKRDVACKTHHGSSSEAGHLHIQVPPSPHISPKETNQVKIKTKILGII